MNTLDTFVEFGDFKINAKRIRYFWGRIDSIQCYLDHSTIPLVVNVESGTVKRILKRIHDKHPFLISVKDYEINSTNVSYFWERENGTQVFFDYPIPLTGHVECNRLDGLCAGLTLPK